MSRVQLRQSHFGRVGEKSHLSAELYTSYILIIECQMNMKFQLFLFPSRLRVQKSHEIPRIFWGRYLFQQEMLKFILTDPQGIVLAELKMLQGLPRPQNRVLSTTWAGLPLEVAPELIIILVAYKALINTL